MERNYSMMLKQLQLGYLEVTLGKNSNEDQCMFCWSTGCGCENKATIKDDPFINLTEKELQYV